MRKPTLGGHMNRRSCIAILFVAGSGLGLALHPTTWSFAMAETPRNSPVPAPYSKSGEAEVSRASATDTLSSCTWETFSSTTSALVNAACPIPAKRVISGGCISSASGRKLIWMHPYEEAAIGSLPLPDNGEWWHATDGNTGWSCNFSSSGTTNTALALCCGT